MDANQKPGNPPPGPLRGMRNNPLLWYVLASVILIMVMNFLVSPKQNIINVDFSTFRQKVENGDIKRVEMTPSYYLGYTLTQQQAAKAQQGTSGLLSLLGRPPAPGAAPASGKSSAATKPPASTGTPPASGSAGAPAKPAAPANTSSSGGSSASGSAPAAGKSPAPGKSSAPKEQVYRATPVQDPSFIRLLNEKGVQYFAVLPKNHPLLGILLTWILPFAAMFLLWRFLSRRLGSMGQNAMTFGQNKTRLIAEGDTGVRFSDVAGAEESKAELVEVVDFLKHPGRYTAIGGKIPKGVLLVGAPGTGKTLLARAVAGEAEVTFFRISGSEFVEMFVGVGAARVRDLFQQARGKAPCIIFIDELDAIGKSRTTGISTNDEREQTLNQLLVEMDGFDARIGVIILAATNRPEVLDPALLRPGRFDRQVVVDKPDLDGREQILKLHSKGVKLAESVDLREVARRTAGFVGADLANLVNEAAIRAVRSGRQQVIQADFDEAFEKLVAGLEKNNRLINPRERKIVAYHETGHALVAFLTPGADPVEKISIVPRGISALGYTLQLPTEERFLMTEGELVGRIDVLLGGRAAEQLVFSEISTGATNDLDKAADIARRMITDYGMSKKFRNVFLPSRKQSPFLGENNYAITREYSESTQQYVDEETARIIDERFQKVLSLLRVNKPAIKRIAEKLLEVEVLDGREFKRMVESGKRKVPAKKARAMKTPAAVN